MRQRGLDACEHDMWLYALRFIAVVTNPLAYIANGVNNNALDLISLTFVFE